MLGKSSPSIQSSQSQDTFQTILKKRELLYAKFSLIYLAGNEWGTDISTADRQTRLEGTDINKCVFALGSRWLDM